MTQSDSEKWNAIYSKDEFSFFPPCKVLFQNLHLLPKQGQALDVACGMGRNAVALAEKGLTTTAIDISKVALDKLTKYAGQQQFDIETLAYDLTQNSLPVDGYDVIVISHYLNRELIPAIKQALNPNGLIFYQTFIKDKVEDIGPSNPDFLLDQNELLNFFNDFQIIFYREEASIGNTKEGFRNEAMVIARK